MRRFYLRMSKFQLPMQYFKCFNDPKSQFSNRDAATSYQNLHKFQPRECQRSTECQHNDASPPQFMHEGTNTPRERGEVERERERKVDWWGEGER